MAREHARIWLDINSDDDFESLPFDAQGLYTRVILTLPDLSYCGVADWKPRRLTTKAPDLTYPRILAAAAALEAGRYCLFDLDTEEVLARSFIRRDELLRNPTMAAAVVKAYSGIASKVLRAAVVTEIRRVRKEHPDYSSWTAKVKSYDVGDALSKIIAKPSLSEVSYTDQIVVPISNTDPVPIGNTDPVGEGNGPAVDNAISIGNTESVGNPCTYTSTLTPAPLGGYVSTEGHQSATPGPYPHRCPDHSHDPHPPKCGRCRDVRKSAEALDCALQVAAVKQRQQFWQEVRDCDRCDHNGFELDESTRQTADDAERCPQHDWSVLHA